MALQQGTSDDGREDPVVGDPSSVDPSPVERASNDAEVALARTSIQEIEKDDWGDPPADASYLVRTCLELRRTPLGQFDTEDVRVMIGQHIGLPTLVPIALGRLAADPLAEGDFYPGDLLAAVLGVPDSYWDDHRVDDARLRQVLRAFDAIDPSAVDDYRDDEVFTERLAHARHRLAAE